MKSSRGRGNMIKEREEYQKQEEHAQRKKSSRGRTNMMIIAEGKGT
jgi:hypothetical protein